MKLKQKIAVVLAALVLTAFAAGCSNNKPEEKDNRADNEIENEIENEIGNDEDDLSDAEDGAKDDNPEKSDESEEKDENRESEKNEAADKKDNEEEKKDDKKDESQNDTSSSEQPEIPEVPAPGVGLPENGDVSSETPDLPDSPDSSEESDTNMTLPADKLPGAANKDDASDTVSLSNKTTADIIEMLYAKKSVDLYLDTLKVDVTDADSVKFYTGLSSTDGLKEISVSEPMMSSQAYSLVLVRVTEGTDAASVAASMKSGINPAKWICVEADHVMAASSGDLALLFMVQSDLEDTMSTSDVLEAFQAVCGTAVEQ